MLRIERFEFVRRVDRNPLLQKLERDALMRRAQGHDLVDEFARFAPRAGQRRLNGVADDQPAHRMRDDVHFRCRLLRLLEPGERADEVDQPHQRLAVDRETPVVQIVVAEDPQRVAR
jgi:hypothetical protein